MASGGEMRVVRRGLLALSALLVFGSVFAGQVRAQDAANAAAVAAWADQ